MNIHIQDPKVSLENFDFIVVPEHDGLDGKNVLKSKGAIHYLKDKELEENKNYLKSKINKEKLVTLVMGGPNKYYDYNNSIIDEFFTVFITFIQKNSSYQSLKKISMNIITKLAGWYFTFNQLY